MSYHFVFLNNKIGLGVRIMVFNAIFNNISAISWRSVLLVKEIGVPEKTTDLLQVTDCIGSYKSNYHDGP